MNRSFATAVTVAMFVVVGCGTGQGIASGPLASPTLHPSPSPSQTPSPTSVPVASAVGLPTGETVLRGGTYVVDDPFPVHISVEVPEGWSSCGLGARELGVCADGIGAIGFLIVDNVVADPCDPSRALLDPPVGPSVEELVTAIANLRGFEATDPVAVTLDGFQGQRFELTAPQGPGLCKLSDTGLGDVCRPLSEPMAWARRSQQAASPRRPRSAAHDLRRIPPGQTTEAGSPSSSRSSSRSISRRSRTREPPSSRASMMMGGSLERRARYSAYPGYAATARAHRARYSSPPGSGSRARTARCSRPTRSVAAARTRRFATQSGSFSSPPWCRRAGTSPHRGARTTARHVARPDRRPFAVRTTIWSPSTRPTGPRRRSAGR